VAQTRRGGARAHAERLYCRDVRTVHSQLHLGANSSALSPHRAGGDSEFAAALQRLPNRSHRYDFGTRWEARSRRNAVGSGAVLVEQAAQGVASRDIQCSRRDRDEEAVLS
jgi:hypothetical protein